MSQGFQQLFGSAVGYYFALNLSALRNYFNKYISFLSTFFISDFIITLVFVVLYYLCQFISKFEYSQFSSISYPVKILAYTLARPFMSVLYIIIFYFLEFSFIFRKFIDNFVFQYLGNNFDYISTAFILFTNVVKQSLQNVEYGPFDEIIVMFLKTGVITIIFLLGFIISSLINPILSYINSYLNNIYYPSSKQTSYLIN